MSELVVRKAESSRIERDFMERAILADSITKTAVPLRKLWDDLCSRKSRVVTSFNTGTRGFLVLSERPHANSHVAPPPIDSRNVEILRRVMFGDAQKVAASDLRLSPSSINTFAGQALREMGLRCVPTRVPVVIVMAAHAHYREIDSLVARQSLVEATDCVQRVLSVPLPDPSDLTLLSIAERSIVGLLLDRRSNAEIARLRATSPRTVANQLASVMHKLQVGGRCGVVHWLVTKASRRAHQIDVGSEPTRTTFETDANLGGNVSSWA